MSLSREFLLATSVFVLASGASAAGAADAQPSYQLQSVLNLGGTGTSWDHIDYDQSRHLAYLSRRADGLTVVDVAKLDRGYPANTDGATSIFKLSGFSAVDRISLATISMVWFMTKPPTFLLISKLTIPRNCWWMQAL